MSLLLSMMTVVWVVFLILFSPSRAYSNLPFSCLKGMVMTPTTMAPLSFAISATTGAAPVPVPPPMPAVMKTMSVPVTSLSIMSALSIMASLPTSGMLPAPRPRVSFSPMRSFLSAWMLFRC
jgi:hypothetical protein